MPKKIKILFFTEEYFKATTGMFNVVSLLHRNINSNYKFESVLIVNYEHWANDKDIFKLPQLSIVEFIKNYFYDLRRKYFVINLFLFVINQFIFFIDCCIYFIFFIFYFKKNKIDILNIHNGGWPAGWVSRIIVLPAKLCGIKIIYSIHNIPFKKNIYYRFISFLKFHFYFIFIDKYIFVSNFLYKSYYKTIKKKSLIIYNTTNFIFSFQENLNLKIDKNKLNIGFMGNISSHKKNIDILNILAVDDEFNFKVHHCGIIDSDYVKKNNVDINSLCEKKVYEFYGFTNDKKAFYSQIDLLCVTSKDFESFGLVVIEAMSFGKPVVVSNYGPFPELILNNYNGFIYKDLQDLNRILCRYKIDRSLLIVHGENAKKYFIENFSNEKFQTEYINVFNLY